MTIGVWKTKYPITSTKSYFMSRGAFKSYGWVITTQQFTYGDTRQTVKEYGKEKCVKGDIIDMILDKDRKQLRYIRNGEDYGIAFEFIEDTEYIAAIDMYSENDAIQIVSYQRLKSL